jgi:hypothetical protein
MRGDCKPLDPDRLKPFVHEDGRMLSLHFEISSIQSRMSRDDPVALQLACTQAMMGFLLFVPAPARMLMLGLGGGSLAKEIVRQDERGRSGAVARRRCGGLGRQPRQGRDLPEHHTGEADCRRPPSGFSARIAEIRMAAMGGGFNWSTQRFG